MRHVLQAAAAFSLTAALSVGVPTTARAASNWNGSGSSAGGTSTGCTSTIIGGHLYRCTFDDEFSGSTLNTRVWVVQSGFATGNPGAIACTVNDPRYINVSGGALHLIAADTGTPYACGGTTTTYEAPTISTYHTFSQQYGMFEVRTRNSVTPTLNEPGAHEAFWLWPDDRYSAINWPASGEIDVSETYSNYSNLSIPYLHYTANDNGGPIPGTNTAYNCVATRGQWNTYDLIWTPTSITINVNGATCLVNTSGDPAFRKPYLMMLSQALGAGTDAMTSTDILPATTDVDYVRVWQ